ncbi:MAG: outer membrane protein assembly factor BamA [Pseudomonadota bacterium]
MKTLKCYLYIFLFSCLSFSLFAAIEDANKVVNSIMVSGNHTIEEAAILSLIETRPGEKYSDEKINNDLKTLYGEGYFDDILIKKEEVDDFSLDLLIVVREKPIVAEVDFGFFGEKIAEKKKTKVDINKDPTKSIDFKAEGDVFKSEDIDVVDEDEIKDVISTSVSSYLDISKLKSDIEAIEKLYYDKGYYLVRVDYVLVDKGQNKVKVLFSIKEGYQVICKRINFIGNKHFSEEELKKTMHTAEGGFLEFVSELGISAAGAYKEELFNIDKELITYFYLNHGFINIKIEQPVVFLSPDKSRIYIDVILNEGDQFYANNISISGDIIYDEEKIREKIQIKQGDVLSYEKIQRDIQRVSALYMDDGYAYVNVIPRTDVNNEDKTVNISFDIQKGNRVYIEKINFLGNDTTRDKILRRQMDIFEGELYSATKISKSKFNIQRLSFFKDVKITQSEGSRDDKLNLDIEVVEQSTGTFSVGAGFNSFESFQLIAQIQKNNLLGYGWVINLMARLGGRSQVYHLNFVDPYFLDTDMSLSVSVYNQQIRYIDFTPQQTGGSIKLGYPIWDRVYRASFGYSLEDVEILNVNAVQESLVSEGLTSSLVFGLSRDTRNRLNMFETTSGMLSTFNSELAGTGFLGGDTDFLKLSFEHKQFIPAFDDDFPILGGSNFQLRGKLGWITSTTDQEVPIFERYFPGGMYSIRGFGIRTLGPTIDVASSSDPESLINQEFHIGGNKEAVFNFEYVFPILKEHGIKGVLFFDMGNAFDNGEFYNFNDFRYSAGFGFRWFSPIAPLRFEWGFPLDREEDENVFIFDFSIGTPF